MTPQKTSVLAWQQEFYPRWHARFSHLANAEARALAWLLAAPDLLDQDAAQWQGKVARLEELLSQPLDCLTAELSSWQASLHLALQEQPQTRIGRYAEKLLAFYFAKQQVLFAQGVQVRSAFPTSTTGVALKGQQTLGEFDFLLQRATGLWHWELATKFYLYAPDLPPRAASDYFIGPNLADSLGAKMQKILFQQLSLSETAELPQPVLAAQAYIKGWIFYPFLGSIDILQAAHAAGLAQQHCRGFWCYQAQLGDVAASIGAAHCVQLSRLAWLAPAVYAEDSPEVFPAAKAIHQSQQCFARQQIPVLFAFVQWQAGQWREVGRSFVVPDDWSLRAEQMPIPRGNLEMRSDD